MTIAPIESLFDLVVRADAYLRQRDHMPPVRFRPSNRVWIEPFFNGVGHSLGFLLYLLPRAWRRRAHVWLNVQMAQHAPGPFPDQARYQTEAIERARDLERRTGRWPAVLFLTSHPETTGASAWLRFELLRQALCIANALETVAPARAFYSHPQCFLAIDPFALDSVPVPVQALYAGLMHSQYVVWDRQVSTQSWLQRHLLLRRSGHGHIAWRLFKALQRNPVLMIVAGGMPSNARLFYAAREWAGTLKDAHQHSSKQQIRYRAMDILSRPTGGALPTETGTIPEATKQMLNAFLNELGYTAGDQESLLDRLRADFKSEVPLRLRLWTVLQRRLAQRGRPLLILPLKHLKEPPYIQLGPYCEMTAETDSAALAHDVNAFYARPLVK